MIFYTSLPGGARRDVQNLSWPAFVCVKMKSWWCYWWLWVMDLGSSVCQPWRHGLCVRHRLRWVFGCLTQLWWWIIDEVTWGDIREQMLSGWSHQRLSRLSGRLVSAWSWWSWCVMEPTPGTTLHDGWNQHKSAGLDRLIHTSSKTGNWNILLQLAQCTLGKFHWKDCSCLSF